MYNLIKKNVIQFDKLILEQYFKLNLDEVDTIILIRLNDLLQKNICELNEDEIAKSMKIDKNELGKRIVELVKKGFITLEFTGIESKEVFSLDETYKRLALLLEKNTEEVNNELLELKIKETINLLEKELQKILSPLEREMVQRWYIDEKYTDDGINEALLKTLKYKNRGVAYIDRLLQANRREQRKEEVKTETTQENIQELFNRLYAKNK